ncbi:MAG: helix-turn-helix domain-containing protein [Desulfovibrio sp.]|uniref:helix-turn-helix domain-containing protein n=1 Tax=Desulfovibrio sp. 7SRBS1 TaxID=3378064 RepID=UPI003B3CCBA7
MLADKGDGFVRFALLGTIPETLSRVLRKMDEEELIQTDGPAIRLLDKESLRQLASGEMRL